MIFSPHIVFSQWGEQNINNLIQHYWTINNNCDIGQPRAIHCYIKGPIIKLQDNKAESEIK